MRSRRPGDEAGVWRSLSASRLSDASLGVEHYVLLACSRAVDVTAVLERLIITVAFKRHRPLGTRLVASLARMSEILSADGRSSVLTP